MITKQTEGVGVGLGGTVAVEVAVAVAVGVAVASQLSSCCCCGCSRSERSGRCGSRRRRSSCSRRRTSRRRRSRRSCREITERINLVVIGDVDAAASDDAAVPFARASHQFVRPAASVNHGTGVTIVAVQPVVALCTDHPYNRVISPISSCNPRRALAGLAHGPSADYGRRICRSNLVSLDLTAPLARKTKYVPCGVR